ncbi:O-methyltransferase [Marinilabilia salmonicolor]|uniref:O-methyltransferase n=1 Tax=Marinilabilia salmonicolor TaxID=989 RepID=UPI00029ABE61|nr:class I SAM-dependent methyltransferase [Marinilabilia salmonicolor]
MYLINARYYKGFGIHSPFVFYLVRELFWESHPFYAFEKIDAARRMLLRNKQRVNVDTLGMPSVVSGNKKSIRKLTAQGSIPDKYGKLIFRLVNKLECHNILELGTGTGMATLYMALPSSRAKIFSIDGNEALQRVAASLFEMTDVGNVTLRNGSFKEYLPSVLDEMEFLDFAFLDGDHQYQNTMQYFEMCLKKSHNNSVFVFDDIHWSPDMEKAWHEISHHPDVTVSMDLYRIGIVFFRKECTRQHYVVRY